MKNKIFIQKEQLKKKRIESKIEKLEEIKNLSIKIRGQIIEEKSTLSPEEIEIFIEFLKIDLLFTSKLSREEIIMAEVGKTFDRNNRIENFFGKK